MSDPESSLSYHRNVLNELRSGDLSDFAFWVGFFLFMNLFNQSEGFQSPILRPHHACIPGYGDHARPPYPGYSQGSFALLDTKAIEGNELVMSYNDAYNLVKDKYTGSMAVTDELRISDWQAAKKI